MSYQSTIKKLHDHNLILEDVVLLGAAIFAGGVHNQVFGGMWDMYQERMTEPFPIDYNPLVVGGEMDANDFAEWLSENHYDGYLCMISIPVNGPTPRRHSWHDCFFYGESIDACIDQAIDSIKQQPPVLRAVQ